MNIREVANRSIQLKKETNSNDRAFQRLEDHMYQYNEKLAKAVLLLLDMVESIAGKVDCSDEYGDSIDECQEAIDQAEALFKEGE